MTLEQLIEQGYAFLSQDNYNESYKCFDLALSHDPGNARILLGLGQTFLYAGGENIPQGIRYIEESIANDDTLALAHYCYGRIMMDANDFEAAKLSFIKSHLRCQEENLATYMLCEIGNTYGDYELISDYIDDAIKITGLDGYMCSNIGVYLERMGRIEESEHWYQKALAMEPDSVYFNFAIGYFYYNQGNSVKAEVYFRTAIELDPNYIQAFLPLCCSLEDNKKYDLAISYCTRAISLNPVDPELQWRLGHYHYLDGKLNRSRSIYSNYLMEHPEHSGVWNNYGMVLNALDESELGRQAFTRAIELKPDNVNALNNLGIYYRKGGDLDQAAQLFGKSLHINPTNVNTLIHCYNLYTLQGKTKLALEKLEQAVNLDPKQYDAVPTLIQEYHKAGYDKDYIELYTEALKNQPENEFIYYHYLNYLEGIGVEDQVCLEIVKKAVIDIPGNKLLYGLGGVLLRNAGYTAEAMAFLQEGLKHDPNNEGCNVLLGNLKESDNAEEARSHYLKVLSHNPNSYIALCALAGHEYYHERQQRAYELALKAANLINKDSEVYRLLYRLKREVNPEKDKHFFSYLFYSASKHRDDVIHRLSYAITLEAPMLIHRLSTQTAFQAASTVTFGQEVQMASSRVKLFNRLIASWSKGEHSGQALLAEALINYFLGDLVRAYCIFAYELDEYYYSNNLLACYYYTMSAVMIGINEEATKKFASEYAEASTAKDPIQQYYKALILHQCEKNSQAISLLQQIWEEYRPAGYQLALIYRAISTRDDTYSKQASDFAFRLSSKEQLDPLFSYGLEPVEAGASPVEFLSNIQPVIHFIEAEEILGSIFMGIHAVEHPFSNLVRSKDMELNLQSMSLKTKLNTIWIKLVGTEIDPEVRNDLVNMIMVSNRAEQFLAEQIYGLNTSEYFITQSDSRNDQEFKFRLCLMVISDLYNLNKIDLEAAINLTNYLQYCLQRIPYMKDHKLVSFMIETCMELLIDAANIPGLFWLDKFDRLVKILREEKKLKDPPLKIYSIFLASIQEG